MKETRFRAGQIVRLIAGPFAGFRGEVQMATTLTAAVSVYVYGRTTPLEVSDNDIEPVPENSN